MTRPILKATDLAAANAAGRAWCAEVNAAVHSELDAVPAERLEPSGRCCGRCSRCGPGSAVVIRKVDRLSCVRFGSARYSVPMAHIGRQVEDVQEFLELIDEIVEYRSQPGQLGLPGGPGRRSGDRSGSCRSSACKSAKRSPR